MMIISPQYGTISLEQIDTDEIKGTLLPGSKSFFCQHDFGTILVQEFRNDHYSLRLAVLNIVKKISFLIKEDTFFLKSTFSLNNSFQIKTQNSSKLKLREGQHIICSSSQDQSMFFEDQKEFHVLESSFSNKLLESYFESFPSLKAYIDLSLTSAHKRKIESPTFISPETKKIIADILRCPYDQSLRKLYFENKVNDLLFEILLKSFNGGSYSNKLKQKEYDAVFNARNIILEDITTHHSIKELSQKVNLNRFKLKTGFKEVFGTGIFEFLLQARMETAYRLVTRTTKPIKEIATETGFEYIANFITAFRRKYGKPPGELRKK